MKHQVTKGPRIALCRKCYGTGLLRQDDTSKPAERCPQCEGTGRVTVSAVIEYDIRAYKEKER